MQDTVWTQCRQVRNVATPKTKPPSCIQRLKLSKRKQHSSLSTGLVLGLESLKEGCWPQHLDCPLGSAGVPPHRVRASPRGLHPPLPKLTHPSPPLPPLLPLERGEVINSSSMPHPSFSLASGDIPEMHSTTVPWLLLLLTTLARVRGLQPLSNPGGF